MPANIPRLVYFESFMNPIARPEPAQRPAVATRNRRKEQVTPSPEAPQEPAAVAHVPAAVVTEPAHPEMPAQAQEATPASAPTAAVPMEAPAGEAGDPVPRDNIPD